MNNDKKIFDGHTHVSILDNDCVVFPEYSFNRLIADMNKNGIEKAIVMINPFIKMLKCKKDFKNQFTKVNEGDKNGELKIICRKCNDYVYKGVDPFRKYNELLIKNASKYKGRLLPLVFLNLSNNTINEEVKYFEDNYKGMYYGYKLHPKFSYRPIGEIESIKSSMPLLIHTGTHEVDHPKHVIEFSKRYNGNIVMAHFCRLNKDSMKEASKNPRLFVDTSPASFLFRTKGDSLYHEDTFDNMKTELDLYYQTLETVGEDSVIFGTDSPWGNVYEEVRVLEMLKVSNTIRNKISYLNLSRALEI